MMEMMKKKMIMMRMVIGHDEGDVDCTDDHDGNDGDNHADHDDNGESANAKSLFGNVDIQMFLYPHPNVNFCQVYLKWYS